MGNLWQGDLVRIHAWIRKEDHQKIIERGGNVSELVRNLVASNENKYRNYNSIKNWEASLERFDSIERALQDLKCRAGGLGCAID
jgi:hypothetical protein